MRWGGQRDDSHYIEKGFTSMVNAIARPLAFEFAAFVIIFCVSDLKSDCFNAYFLRVTSQ